MKQKMLLFGSFSAMLLGAVMLIMPAHASVTAGCTSKHCEIGGDIPKIVGCEVVANGGCACPFPHPDFNGCVLTGTEQPLK